MKRLYTSFVVFLILIMHLILVSGVFAGDTFVGHTSPGDGSAVGDGDRIIFCGPYRANQAGSISQIKGSFRAVSGTIGMTTGIYTESGGTYTKLVDSDEVIMDSSMSTRIWTLDSPLTVDTSTDYYIVYNVAGQYQRKEDTYVGNTKVFHKADTYVAGSLPDSVSSVSGANGFEIVLFGFEAAPDSSTAYFMGADGTATKFDAGNANGGNANDPAHYMNVATHNVSTFSPDQTIYLTSNGGTFTSAIRVPSSGTNGHPIIYTNVAGETVTMTNCYSLDGLSWTDLGGGIYRATFSGSVYGMWVTESSTLLPKADNASFTDGVGEYYNDGSYVYYKPSSGTPNENEPIIACQDWTSQSTLDDGANTAAFSVKDRSYVTIKKNTTGSINVSKANAGVLAWNNETITSDLVGIVIDGLTFTELKDPIAIFHSKDGYTTGGTIRNCSAIRCESFYRNYCSASPVTEHVWTINNNTGTDIGTVDGTRYWNYQSYGGDQEFAADREFIGIQNHCNCLIYNNKIIGGNNRAFYLYTKTSCHSTGNEFYNNFIYKVKWANIYISMDSADAYIDNNKFYNNIIVGDNYPNSGEFIGGSAMYLPAIADSNQYMNYFYNNTIYGLAWGIFRNKYEGQSHYYNFTFKNNLVLDCTLYWYEDDASVSNYVIDNNGYYGATRVDGFQWAGWYRTFYQWWHTYGNDINGVEQDPILVGGSYNQDTDFKLTASSPDKYKSGGVDVGLTTDYFGRPYNGVFPIGASNYSTLTATVTWRTGKKLRYVNSGTLVTIPVRLTRPLSQDVTVDITVSGVNPANYSLSTNTVTIPAGKLVPTSQPTIQINATSQRAVITLTNPSSNARVGSDTLYVRTNL